MKPLLLFFALATAGTGYQASSQAPSANIVAAAPGGSALLRQYDMAALLQTISPGSSEWRQAQGLNGFFGPDGYRIELVLLKVQRDGKQPAVYHMQGKSRYKKTITALSGTITLTQAVAQPLYTAREIAAYQDGGLKEENARRMYTATGTFELRAGASQPEAGVYRGTVALDFALGQHGTLAPDTRTARTLTQGGGTKYVGTWTAAASAQPVPVLWVGDILRYQGPQALTNLVLGDRSMSINPKYAKQGWNSFWRNDEWWAETPRPAPGM